MNKIFVVGKTSNQKVFVVSQERKFILNEYLKINDEDNNFPIGEIVETFSYSSCLDSTFEDNLNMYKDLSSVNIDVNKPFHIGILKMVIQLHIPIKTCSVVTIPDFKEIEKLVMSANFENGLVLGEIMGTSSLSSTLPNEFKNKCCLLNDGEIQAQKGVPFLLNYYSFKEYPHIGLFGGSGSGKTHALRVIMEEIMEHRVPGIAFDPHYELDFSTESDFKGKNYKNNHEILMVGRDIGIDFTELNTGELISLLSFVGEMSQPMIGAIESLHEFRDTMVSLINRIENVKVVFDNEEKSDKQKEEITGAQLMLYRKYKSKVSGSATLQALLWRLKSLEKMNIFTNDISKVEACMLNRKIAVIRSSSYLILKVFASYVLNKLYKKRRAFKDDSKNSNTSYTKFPPFFVIGDEAHNLAVDGKVNNPTKTILRVISQEARKYGVFLVLGTQRPALLDSTIVSQLNTKIIFRTSIKRDMDMIKTETNLNDLEFSILPTLTSGNAFISSATLSKNFSIKFRCTNTKSPYQEHPFDELDGFCQGNEKLRNILLKQLPISIETIPKIHGDIIRAYGSNININDIKNELIEMCEDSLIKKERTPFGIRFVIK